MRLRSTASELVRSDGLKYAVRGTVYTVVGLGITAWSYTGVWIAWAVIQ